MLILAFESSAKAASAALLRDGALIAQSFQNGGLTHSRTLLPMARDLLDNAEHSLESVDLFAVARGPGSFTGVRIGVAAVKGLAWALDKPVCGVSTLGAMAWHGLCAAPGTVICPVMDARRSEVYNALFTIEDGKPIRLTDDRAIPLESLAADLSGRGGVDKTVYLLGDGAVMSYECLKAKGLSVTLAPEPVRFQTAWGVAMAAMEAEPVTAGELVPEYLRLSQAERQRRRVARPES